MIIDSYVYALPPKMRDINYEPSICEKGVFQAIYNYSPASEALFALKLADPANILDSMDKWGIEKAVIHAFPWLEPKTCQIHNDYIMELYHENPQRFLPVCAIQPKDRDWKQEALARAGQGCVGFNINPIWQECSLDNADAAKLAMFCAEANIFLRIDIEHSYKISKASGAALCQFLKKAPNTKIIASHLGGLVGLYNLYDPVAKLLRNVWFDTSVSSTMRMVEFYIQAGLSKKLIFGSDFPFNHCHCQDKVFLCLKNMPYPETVIADILGLNFMEMMAA